MNTRIGLLILLVLVANWAEQITGVPILATTRQLWLALAAVVLIVLGGGRDG